MQGGNDLPPPAAALSYFFLSSNVLVALCVQSHPNFAFLTQTSNTSIYALAISCTSPEDLTWLGEEVGKSNYTAFLLGRISLSETVEGQ